MELSGNVKRYGYKYVKELNRIYHKAKGANSTYQEESAKQEETYGEGG